MVSSTKWFCFMNEMDDFFQQLKECRYALIKGDALSVQAYGSVGRRNHSDIDILVSLKNISYIEQILAIAGFHSSQKSRKDRLIEVSSSHQVAPWVKYLLPWGELVIDLNFDIFWGEYEGMRAELDEFLDDTVEMDIYGIQVKTLPPVKAMVQLMLHHYKDMNSIYLLATRKSIKYSMFQDIFHLLKNNSDYITVNNLYETCHKYGIIPYAFYVLYYTGELFNDRCLDEFIEAFRTSEGEELLELYGLCARERRRWKCDFDTRLKSNDLFSLIKDDLTEKDMEKIALNRQIFMRT